MGIIPEICHSFCCFGKTTAGFSLCLPGFRRLGNNQWPKACFDSRLYNGKREFAFKQRTLAVPNSSTLALSNGNKIIIDNTATSKLIVESCGKLVLNKTENWL